MEMVAHLQVFPLPSGNTKRSKERKKKRGVRKRGTPKESPHGASHHLPKIGVAPPLHLYSTCTWEWVLTPTDQAQPYKSRTGKTKVSPALGRQNARSRPSCPVILPY